jgi:hypothetical protein
MGKTYLGDSVYADMIGDMIVLTTENGYGPSNRIGLEPEVFDALLIWRKAIVDAELAAARKEKPRGEETD